MTNEFLIKLAIGLFVVAMICLIYYLFFSDTKKRETVKAAVEGSNGTFDRSAREALQTLYQMRTLNPADRLQRANLIRFYQADNDVTRLTRDEAILAAGDYQAVLVALQLTDYPELENPGAIIHEAAEFTNLLMRELQMEELGGFADVANRANVQQIARRADAAIETSNTKAEAVEKFLEPVHTSKPQNVHDTSVINDLSETLSVLRATHDGTLYDHSLDECRTYIADKYRDTPKGKTALAVLNQIASTGDTPISTYGASESEILNLVWRRCFHEKNSEEHDNMKDAVVDALSDSFEKGSTVCANGRTARLLASHATLDYDSRVGLAQSFEDYRNQIYNETKTIIADEIERGKISDDEEIRNMAKSYDEPEIVPSEKAIEQFNAILKTRIDDNLRKYETKLRPKDMETVASECYVAAAL